jgi:rhamnosyltransferase
MNRICAIVVTYFPDAAVRDNLAALRPQVDHVIVVDNGSSAEGIAMLTTAGRELDLTLIENGDNLGIAEALNIGVKAVTDSEWVVLFDQDSRVREGFIANMLHCAESYAPEARAALFVPQYFDMRFKYPLPPVLAPDGTLAVAMTSGSLIRRILFDEVGYFEDLFIYEVDYEFSLRIRKLGYTIRECRDAALDHSPGEGLPFYLFGKRLFYTTNYKPMSRYYLHRNSEWLHHRYGKDFPEYFRFSKRILRMDYVKMLLAEKQKWAKLRFMLKGKWDGMRGNMQRLKP